MLFKQSFLQQTPLRQAITDAYRSDEVTAVENLLAHIPEDAAAEARIKDIAARLMQEVRSSRKSQGGMDAFMDQYDLSSKEGIVLMCLAEALLRVPDKVTKDELIQDKLTAANWHEHLGTSESTFVNASTWGLMLTGKLLAPRDRDSNALSATLRGWLGKTSKPIIRKAVNEAMKILGQQFVMSETIEGALKRAVKKEAVGYRYSFDMLGEAAHTAQAADDYMREYEKAIAAIAAAHSDKGLKESAGISVKLSALHPRYELAEYHDCVPALTARLLKLAQQAAAANIKLTVDAEEMERLDMSFDIIEAVFSDASLKDWNGLGLAVQAYQKRCFYIIDWLVDLAKRNNKSIMVRLVKGAYWDTDIKFSQVEGFNNYEVFTRKASTDVSYVACARKLADAGDLIYPQFATHNARSVATIIDLMRDRPKDSFEFQCLQGMGDSLYDHVVGKDKYDIPARIYAPVGVYEDLLPYLVRRLLENGANTSFVNRIIDENIPIAELVKNPVDTVKNFDSITHPKIPLPEHIYGPTRLNSHGLDLSNFNVLRELDAGMSEFADKQYTAQPTIGDAKGDRFEVFEPADHSRKVGDLIHSTPDNIEAALAATHAAHKAWSERPVNERADILRNIAVVFEEHRAEIMTLIMRDGGRNIIDALSELREATDFCRYYAAEAERVMPGRLLPGPTGETNLLELHSRGTWFCISPWNFPAAIFCGQILGALATGNCVIAKAAEQTSIVAYRLVELMYEAGIPRDVLHLLTGRGSKLGPLIYKDKRINGVLFTGSTEVAQSINRVLAERDGEIVPLIAETGGQNCMIVDSTALPEQVVVDVMRSAFGSAGQRCSALRVLCVQEEVADSMIDILKGAMAEMSMGYPGLLSTDVGPVIDEGARKTLQAHADYLEKTGTHIATVPLGEAANTNGTFFAPRAYEIDKIGRLTCEVFGPILHVVRYKKKNLSDMIAQINATGFGLTFGMHSRIDSAVMSVCEQVEAGNCYVNRNMIGAVVGVQPFGGMGLSGTGPKAGGPYMLPRLCHEKVITINTAATGGNAQLMSIGE